MIDIDIIGVARGLQDAAFTGGAREYQELILDKLQAEYDLYVEVESVWGGRRSQGVSKAMSIICNTNPSVDERLKEDNSV